MPSPESRPGPRQPVEQYAHLPSGIDLCFETFGSPGDPPVLLVMGLGGPMTWWHTDFCTQLADRGHFVIRYDNRDTGRSTRLNEYRVSRGLVIRAALGLAKAPYSITDMADDAIGLLDHLGLDRVNIVGVSMGGMIAQTIAIEHPDRVASLTSIMSTTGRKTVGFQSPKVLPGLLAPAGNTKESYLDRSLQAATMIQSPGFPTTRADHTERAEVTWERGWSGPGVLRQMLAVLTQPDRTRALRSLDVPTTVVHGLDDPLVHRSGGKATAKAVPGARLVLIPGMAHDLARGLWPRFLEEISANVRRGQARSSRSAA